MRTFTQRFIVTLLLVQGLALQYAAAGPRRAISAPQWQQLTSDKAFSYKNDIENAVPAKRYEPNILQKIVNAVFSLFNGRGGTLLLWLVVFFALVFISYMIFSSKNNFLFERRKKEVKSEGPPGEKTEDIALTDWDALLHNAVQQNDVRQAIRYSYMRVLQLLQHNGLIRYRSDKTNYDYYSELTATNYKQPFKQLSRQYEYAWYGQYNLSAEAFNDYMRLFDNVKKQLGA
jgi:hypothetical protein